MNRNEATAEIKPPTVKPPTIEELAYMLAALVQHMPKRSIRHPAGFAANQARALLARVEKAANALNV